MQSLYNVEAFLEMITIADSILYQDLTSYFSTYKNQAGENLAKEYHSIMFQLIS